MEWSPVGRKGMRASTNVKRTAVIKERSNSSPVNEIRIKWRCQLERRKENAKLVYINNFIFLNLLVFWEEKYGRYET